MQLYTITLEVVTRKTITLAADTLAEATLAAQDVYHHLPPDIGVHQMSVVEAKPIAEAA